MNKKDFAKTVLNKNIKVTMIYTTLLSLDLIVIYPA